MQKFQHFFFSTTKTNLNKDNIILGKLAKDGTKKNNLVHTLVLLYSTGGFKLVLNDYFSLNKKIKW
jgi:hypothetical protein